MSTVHEAKEQVAALVSAVAQKAQAEQQAEFDRVKTVLRLDQLAIEAQRHADAIAARASEISALLAETEIPAASRETITGRRPGLAVWFDTLEAKRTALHDVTFATQARLTRGLAVFARLGPADLVPREQEHLILTALGECAPILWRTRETLANVRPLADIDENIAHLKVAFEALSERLQAQAIA
jgi:hypothetical protein